MAIIVFASQNQIEGWQQPSADPSNRQEKQRSCARNRLSTAISSKAAWTQDTRRTYCWSARWDLSFIQRKKNSRRWHRCEKDKGSFVGQMGGKAAAGICAGSKPDGASAGGGRLWSGRDVCRLDPCPSGLLSCCIWSVVRMWTAGCRHAGLLAAKAFGCQNQRAVRRRGSRNLFGRQADHPHQRPAVRFCVEEVESATARRGDRYRQKPHVGTDLLRGVVRSIARGNHPAGWTGVV